MVARKVGQVTTYSVRLREYFGKGAGYGMGFTQLVQAPSKAAARRQALASTPGFRVSGIVKPVASNQPKEQHMDRVTAKHLKPGDTIRHQLRGDERNDCDRVLVSATYRSSGYDLKFADGRTARGGTATKWCRVASAGSALKTRTGKPVYQGHEATHTTGKALMGAAFSGSGTLTSSRTHTANRKQAKGHSPRREPAMAKSEKASLLTNSAARKEKARKAGKCQICGEKTSGFSAVINYDKGTVSVVKAREGHAFYCKDHAEKKRKRYQWKLARKASPSTTGRGSRRQKRGSGSNGSKPAAKRTRSRKASTNGAKATPRKRTRKATVSAAAKPARKRAPRKATAKRTRKATATAAKSGDPF